MNHSWLFMDIRVKELMYPHLSRLSLILSQLSDDIIQNVGVAHRVELSCWVVHELAGVCAVKDAHGTG